jgi:hypothetical protein
MTAARFLANRDHIDNASNCWHRHVRPIGTSNVSMVTPPVETQESVMKNVQEIHRKRVGKNKHDALMAMEDGAGGGREKKKGRHAKRDRDRPSGRESTESPRGSTIPPYPKQRIDD